MQFQSDLDSSQWRERRQQVLRRLPQPLSALSDEEHTLYSSWPLRRGICQEIHSRRTTDAVDWLYSLRSADRPALPTTSILWMITSRYKQNRRSCCRIRYLVNSESTRNCFYQLKLSTMKNTVYKYIFCVFTFSLQCPTHFYALLWRLIVR